MPVFFKERSLMCILSCTLGMTAAARASILEFHADINGICATTGSPGTGTGTFTLDTTTGLLEWEIVISGLTSPELAAHLHGPITPGCGAVGNGVVLLSLLTGSPKIGSETLTAQQQQDLMDGLFYVNIHTDDFLSGEISGEIVFVPPPVPTMSLWGLIALALLILTGQTIEIRHRIRSMSVQRHTHQESGIHPL